MSKRLCITFFIVIISANFVFSQKSRRWRLDFQMLEKPTRIVITEPDGIEETYWYFRYIVRNDTNRDIKYSINIKMLIDKPAPGVTEDKIPELFYNAKIPHGTKDKEAYINFLRKYYDTDFPAVKEAVYKKLRLHPILNNNQKKVWNVLADQYPRSVSDIMKDVNLSHSETETALESLISRNLAIASGLGGSPTFLGSKISYANFSIDGFTISKKKGEIFSGWEIISFSKNNVILKKNDIIKKITKGSVIEYKYSKSNKTPFEKTQYYHSGIDAKGRYRGRNKENIHQFKKNIIEKKSSHRGIAIFYGVSPETDFMAILVSGLVNPIVKRYKNVTIQNEVLMMGYKIPGDELSIHQTQLEAVYKKWEILSTRLLRTYQKKE